MSFGETSFIKDTHWFPQKICKMKFSGTSKGDTFEVFKLPQIAVRWYLLTQVHTCNFLYLPSGLMQV